MRKGGKMKSFKRNTDELIEFFDAKLQEPVDFVSVFLQRWFHITNYLLISLSSAMLVALTSSLNYGNLLEVPGLLVAFISSIERVIMFLLGIISLSALVLHFAEEKHPIVEKEPLLPIWASASRMWMMISSIVIFVCAPTVYVAHWVFWWYVFIYLCSSKNVDKSDCKNLFEPKPQKTKT